MKVSFSQLEGIVQLGEFGIGFAYAPNDDFEFYGIEVKHSDNSYHVWLHGNNFPFEHNSVVDLISANTHAELIELLPDFVINTQYHLVQSKDDIPVGSLMCALRHFYPSVDFLETMFKTGFKDRLIGFIQIINTDESVKIKFKTEDEAREFINILLSPSNPNINLQQAYAEYKKRINE